MRFDEKFVALTKDCITFLETYKQPEDPFTIIDDERWIAWHAAAYNENGFMYDGNFFLIYNKSRQMDTRALDFDMTRGCITFCLRQMRFTGTNVAIENGELLLYLKHWVELVEKS